MNGVMKNLVYFSVFYNPDYFRLAGLLMKSMRLYSSTDQFDLLLLTSPDFREQAEVLSKILPIQIYYIPLTTIFQAACARLRIFSYPGVEQYAKILYLDTDIIIKKDLAPLFASFPDREVLYGLESGTIGSPSFGGSRFFDFNVIDHRTTGINTGTLMFWNCQVIRDLFGRILAHVNDFVEQPPVCMDQPFINYHVIKDGLYDNQWFAPHVSLYEDEDAVMNYETSAICHFSFPIGNWSHKFGRMAAFFKGLLTESETESESSLFEKIQGQTYLWGDNGWLKFGTEGRLETFWGVGVYTILGANRVKADWHNHHHVLQFSPDLNMCISTRVQPLDFNSVTCSRYSSELVIYGNSHAVFLFEGCTIPLFNFWQVSITMHRIGRDNTIVNFKPVCMNKNTVFCLVYGEVDVRCHIGKQIKLGRSLEEICQTLVDGYFRTIKNRITEYRAIIVAGVTPPIDPADHVHTHTLGQEAPFVGTNEERVTYTAALNEALARACATHGYIYFAPYDYCRREDGCMDASFSDGCIHIGKNGPILEAFAKLYANL